MEKKMAVEECLTLDINQLKRHGFIKANEVSSGKCTWPSQSTLGFEVSTRDMDKPFIRLIYSWMVEKEEGQPVDYCVALKTTRPAYGGLRWWFICPLIVNNQPCNRQVARLYLATGTPYFGCRLCHQLTYTSCQESQKDTAIWRKVVMKAKEPWNWRRLKRMTVPKKETGILPELSSRGAGNS